MSKTLFKNEHVAPLELRGFQKKAVSAVADALNSALQDTTINREKKIVLKSPTGSGKTVMLSQVMRRACTDALTLVLTPGAGALGAQTLRSLRRNLEGDAEITVEQVTLPLLQQKPSRGLVAVANWEALTTRDKKTGEYSVYLTRNGENRNLFDWIADATTAGIPLVIMVDEAHYGASKDATAIQRFLEDIRAEVKAAGGDPFITVEASATPLLGGSTRMEHEVSRSDVIAAGLMRKNGVLNAGIREKLESEESKDGNLPVVEEVLLEGAFEKQQELTELYLAAGSSYKPLLAVQIPNSRPGKEAQERVEEFFAQHGITYDNGQMAIFTAGQKSEQMETISSPDSKIRVLIYKQAIATGWDCPRAQILVGFRHITSKIFTVQNIGRFARTTEAKHYPEQFDALNNFYVYSNLNGLGVDIHKDDPSATDHTPMLSAMGAQGDVNLFNSLNLPFSTYRRTNQDSIHSSTLNSLLRPALTKYAGADKIDVTLRRGERLSDGTFGTESWMQGDDNVTAQKMDVSVSRGIVEKELQFQRDVEAIVKSSGDYGNNARLARDITKKTIAYYKRELRESPEVIVGALLEPENFTHVTRALEAMLASDTFEGIRVDRKHNDDEPAPATVRELRFLGSMKLPQSMLTLREGKKRVQSGMDKYALYAYKDANTVDAEGYWQEETSGPEKYFEKHLLSLHDRGSLELVWVHKNAPYSNGENFSLGLSITFEESGKKKVANFYPDYILMVKKNGKTFPMIVEVKGEDAGSYDSLTLAKARAARSYYKHTGVPFVVLQQRGSAVEDFGVVSADSEDAKNLSAPLSFSHFVDGLDDVSVVEFSDVGAVETAIPDDKEWMKTLGM